MEQRANEKVRNEWPAVGHQRALIQIQDSSNPKPKQHFPSTRFALANRLETIGRSSRANLIVLAESCLPVCRLQVSLIENIIS